MDSAEVAPKWTGVDRGWCGGLKTNKMRGPGPEAGVVYTRPTFVSLALDLAGYVPSKNLLNTRVLDVGCGYGQFIGEVVNRLVSCCASRGVRRTKAIQTIQECVRGVEVDPSTARRARSRILEIVQKKYGDIGDERRGISQTIDISDFLDWTPGAGAFDLIVGNLPYVKYEAIRDLPHDKSHDWLRKQYDCFVGRADYSVAMMQKCVNLLSKQGAIAVITSNRFTQAEYGKRLRILIADRLQCLDELDLSRVNAFEHDVSAYASLFLSSPQRNGKSHYVRFAKASNEGIEHLLKFGLKSARSCQWYTANSRGSLPKKGGQWSPLPFRVTRILQRLARDFPSIEESGFQVRNGPATGAKDVFIKPLRDFPLGIRSKKRYLFPVCDGGPIDPSIDYAQRKHILSVYERGTGRLLNLNELPSDVREYLADNKKDLKTRYIVREDEREWWSAIDSFDPELTYQRKVLVPDLQSGRSVWMDSGVVFPDHSVVYVTGPAKSLSPLTRLLQSSITDLFRAWKAPMMNGGTPRAYSHVIGQLPYPDVSLPSVSGGSAQSLDPLWSAYDLCADEMNAIERAHSSVIHSS
jgi:SAM-dependent methyltransferase